MIENKKCRHPMASGHFYKGNCEDCVIERWEACNALLEIRDRQIEVLVEALEKIKFDYEASGCMECLTGKEAVPVIAQFRQMKEGGK